MSLAQIPALDPGYLQDYLIHLLFNIFKKKLTYDFTSTPLHSSEGQHHHLSYLSLKFWLVSSTLASSSATKSTPGSFVPVNSPQLSAYPLQFQLTCITTFSSSALQPIPQHATSSAFQIKFNFTSMIKKLSRKPEK